MGRHHVVGERHHARWDSIEHFLWCRLNGLGTHFHPPACQVTPGAPRERGLLSYGTIARPGAADGGPAPVLADPGAIPSLCARWWEEGG